MNQTLAFYHMGKGDANPTVAADYCSDLIIVILGLAHCFVVKADAGKALTDFVLGLLVVGVFFQGRPVADSAP